MSLSNVPGSGRGPSLRLRVLLVLARRYLKPRTLQRPDPIASRAFVDAFVLPPLGARVEAANVGGVAGEWSRALRAGPDRPVLLYLHGGAFVLGSSRTHRPIAAAFARRGFQVFVPDYRLAPEHPFPAGLDDAVAAYRGLLAAGTAPGRIVLAGESAGGALALSALVRLREAGLPLPAAASVFSPWADLACTSETMRSNADRDPLFDPAYGPFVAGLYLGGHSPRDPLASPLFADLAGLPPLLLQVGESEVLRDDAVRIAQTVLASGGQATLEVWPFVPHGWQLLAAVLPEARRAVDRAAAFLRGRIGA